jgi:hypothetical protein
MVDHIGLPAHADLPDDLSSQFQNISFRESHDQLSILCGKLASRERRTISCLRVVILFVYELPAFISTPFDRRMSYSGI